MQRYSYSDNISNFLKTDDHKIIGQLSQNGQFTDLPTQKRAWSNQISLLKESLKEFNGGIIFEFSIPRMGKRIDVVLVIKGLIIVLEFKNGVKEYLAADLDQVWDYCLDLKNFHETSHRVKLFPVLVATNAPEFEVVVKNTLHNDGVYNPIRSNAMSLAKTIAKIVKSFGEDHLDYKSWVQGRYSPTPTIIEAAKALYNGHTVSDISRNDAEATNLTITSKYISEIIRRSESDKEKSICFLTGVPGAGKTLVGLNIVSEHLNKDEHSSVVLLSGNGPLVAVLQAALTQDKYQQEKEKGNKVKKGMIKSQVKSMIQNVHHFRDDCLESEVDPPFEHVAVFDEAQRAWNKEQTANFMKTKKENPNFQVSEPEFLISCLDRHKDWAVVVCLVGGGQEINTGEAGIKEWIESIIRSFPKWRVYISDKLYDEEYAAGQSLEMLKAHQFVEKNTDLHLAVSKRSFRAENLSSLVKNILDMKLTDARHNFKLLEKKYPIILTRDIVAAKKWLKSKARGSERYGIIVSSQAQRLKPFAIDVRSAIDPVQWFLEDKDHVRSSYYLEDVATEFQVQGLELDWTCVMWDGDFRYAGEGWETFSFRGKKWMNINKGERKSYLKNAYRVLLTRARMGMVIVIPKGDVEDKTRCSEFYDSTFNYLSEIGIPILDESYVRNN